MVRGVRDSQAVRPPAAAAPTKSHPVQAQSREEPRRVGAGLTTRPQASSGPPARWLPTRLHGPLSPWTPGYLVMSRPRASTVTFRDRDPDGGDPRGGCGPDRTRGKLPRYSDVPYCGVLPWACKHAPSHQAACPRLRHRRKAQRPPGEGGPERPPRKAALLALRLARAGRVG